MAFTVQNGPGVPRVNRGQPLNAGSVNTNQAVAFTLPSPREFVLNKIVITMVGGSAITAVLEGSIDGGATWFVIPAITSDVTQTGTADTAASFAARYEVSGLGGGCLFRFGPTAITSGPGVVWIAMA